MHKTSSYNGSQSSTPMEEAIEYAGSKPYYQMPRRSYMTAAERARQNLNAKLANPLQGYSQDELRKLGLRFSITHQMGDEVDIRAFEIGAVLAQAPEKFAEVENLLTKEEMEALRKEFTNRWSQPALMYVVIVICSMCAAVQGMGKSSAHISGWA